MSDENIKKICLHPFCYKFSSFSSCLFVCLFFFLNKVRLNRFDLKRKKKYILCERRNLLLFYDNRDSFSHFFLYLLCILSLALEVTSHHTSCELWVGFFSFACLFLCDIFHWLMFFYYMNIFSTSIGYIIHTLWNVKQKPKPKPWWRINGFSYF